MDKKRPSEPWFSFLTDLDAYLEEPTDFHCIGGFAVSQHYGFSRETADLDVLTFRPKQNYSSVMEYAGQGSPLHKKHRVYLDCVGVANYPDDYETRLQRAFPFWEKVCLWVLEPHDLALSKLERSGERDVRDVMYLAQAGLINRETLTSRFAEEMEAYLGNRTPTWHRNTLKMWNEACWPK